MDIEAVVATYRRRVDERQQRLREFMDGKRPFLVIQRPACGPVWTDCSTPEKIAVNNLAALAAWAELEWTDELPYLEPWAGVGIYAAAFGCEYFWRENESPATHYRYHKMSEVRDVAYPDWRKNPIMTLVLDSIDRMNELSGGRLPITLTDTQSPFDTATLIVDSTEFIVGCYEEPDTAKRLLNQITDLIIEFSEEQLRHIGQPNAARPGHIMTSSTFGAGFSVSDDNLSFCSPDFNAEFALPYNYRLAEKFGGIAIHSCGIWAHTMAILERSRGVTAIDCATAIESDPGPNCPAAVRDALRGKGIVTKIRPGNNMEKIISSLAEIVSADIQLIVQIGHDPVRAEQNYRQVTDKLHELYQR